MKFDDLEITDIGNQIELVGAIYAGKGMELLCYLPGEQSIRSCTRSPTPLEMDADDWEKFLRQTDILEVQANTQDKNGTIAKAIIRKSQRQIDQWIVWECYRRDSFRCGYCGNDQCPLTVDHLIPYEDGGPSIAINLLTVCKKCNKTRGNKTLAEWFADPYYLKVSAAAGKDPDTNFSNAIWEASMLKRLEGIKRVYVRSR